MTRIEIIDCENVNHKIAMMISDERTNFVDDVYCEPGYMYQIIRKGTLLCNATNEELQRYHEQSKLNLH